MPSVTEIFSSKGLQDLFDGSRDKGENLDACIDQPILRGIGQGAADENPGSGCADPADPLGKEVIFPGQTGEFPRGAVNDLHNEKFFRRPGNGGYPVAGDQERELHGNPPLSLIATSVPWKGMFRRLLIAQ